MLGRVVPAPDTEETVQAFTTILDDLPPSDGLPQYFGDQGSHGHCQNHSDSYFVTTPLSDLPELVPMTGTALSDPPELVPMAGESSPKQGFRAAHLKQKHKDLFSNLIAQLVEQYELRLEELRASQNELDELRRTAQKPKRDSSSIPLKSNNRLSLHSTCDDSHHARGRNSLGPTWQKGSAPSDVMNWARHGDLPTPRSSLVSVSENVRLGRTSVASQFGRTSVASASENPMHPQTAKLPLSRHSMQRLKSLEGLLNECDVQVSSDDHAKEFCSAGDAAGDAVQDELAELGTGELDGQFKIFKVWRQDGESMARSSWKPSARFHKTHTFHQDMFNRRALVRFMSLLVINPESNTRSVWDLLTFLVVAFDVIMVPLQLSFGVIEQLHNGFIPSLFGLFWSFDISLNSFTAFYEKGQLVRDQNLIIYKYASSWLVADLCAVTGDWIRLAWEFSEPSSDNVIHYLRLLKLVRLFKMKQFAQAISDRIDSESQAIFFNFFCYTAFLIVVSHYIACAWYRVGTQAGEERTWVNRHSMGDESVSYRYSMSLFWALTLFMSSSDIFPRNETEQFFADVVLTASIILFSSLLAMVTGSVMQLWTLRNEERRQRMLLRRYLHVFQISAETTHRIERYLEYLQAKTQQLVSEEQVTYLQKLSRPLQEQLRFESFDPIVSRHPVTEVMHSVSKAFMRSVSALSLARGDEIFTCGEDARQAFLLTNLVIGDLVYWPGVHDAGGTKTPMSSARMPDRRPDRLGGEYSVLVAEPSLWTPWVHLGDLEANAMCQILVVDAKMLRQVSNEDVKLLKVVQKYATAYVEQLNAMDEMALSDILHFNLKAKLHFQRGRSMSHKLQRQGSLSSMKDRVSGIMKAFHLLGGSPHGNDGNDDELT